MKLGVLRAAVYGSILTATIASAVHAHQEKKPPNQAFHTFVDVYFLERFAAYPSEATAAGVHELDDQLEDMSKPAIQRRIQTLHRQLEELTSFKPDTLSFDESIDKLTLDGQIRSELQSLETLKTWETNPMGYIAIPGGAVDGLVKRNFAPAADRIKSATARMKQIPALHAAARANITNPPKEFTDLAIRMAKGSIGFFEKSLPTWVKSTGVNDPKLLDDFNASVASASASTKATLTWLETEVKPRSNGVYAIGEANFLAKLKYDELVEISLADLLAKGEANLEKDYKAFVATAKKIDASKTPAEVMKMLSNDHPSADDLIPSAKRSIEEARQFLIDRKIVTVPSDVRPRIEETPAYARSGSFASMDTPGPYETKATEAFYYITPVEKDWDAKHAEEHLRLYNPPVMSMINVHEAYPGHYLQFLYAPKFPTKTRKLVFCGTNVEGWAHYTEQMMVDEGFGGGDPKIRLAQLQEALLRDCRYVVGVKLHTKGLTVEEGAKIFVEKSFQEPANAYEESRRGAYNPTYLYYTFGKLQILDLREEFKAKNKGSLEDFHNAYVSQGGIPIPLVRKILFK